ncbi:MAG TPA: metallophosphoesterase [Halobacteriales archaeon]|nr:metallophosphoesterase [Halobacteriales archaeon]
MELALVADSHIPGRAKSIPEPFVERIREADHVVHAGDFNSLSAYEALWELAARLTAVPGNMDPSGLPHPPVATLERAGVTFVVTHGHGSPREYEAYVASVAREEGGDVAIAGHTHVVLDTTVDGVRLLNPGSVTGAPPARRATMMTAVVEGGDVDVTVHDADEGS